MASDARPYRRALVQPCKCWARGAARAGRARSAAGRRRRARVVRPRARRSSGVAPTCRARDRARRDPDQGPRLDERHLVAGHASVGEVVVPAGATDQVRRHAGADRGGRRAIAAAERSRSLRRDGRQERRDARAVRRARDGVADRCDRPDRGRVGHRQGARGARDPRRVGARKRAVRRRRLQRDRREPDRLAPVRPREGRVHRRGARSQGRVRRGDAAARCSSTSSASCRSPAQAKLLRVLEAQTVQPVGADRPVKVDTRVVAATHRDLARMVAAKEFRFDLFYRLAVVHVALPPLRERLEDLPHLIAHVLPAPRHRRRARSTATTSSACAATPGRATCASCATCSSARGRCRDRARRSASCGCGSIRRAAHGAARPRSSTRRCRSRKRRSAGTITFERRYVAMVFADERQQRHARRRARRPVAAPLPRAAVQARHRRASRRRRRRRR